MALSGSFSTSAISGHYILRVDWTAAQSATNNTSTVTAKVYLVNDWALNIGSRTGNKVSIVGKVYEFTSPAISTTGTHLLATVTSSPIAHKADGSSYEISMSCSFKMNATITHNNSGQYVGTMNAADSSITLDTIARASQPSCITWPNNTADVGEFGDTISIHMNRQSSSFTHTVRYEFGSASGTIATGVTTGTTWTIPLSLMNLIPEHLGGSGRIFVDTYNGSTLIGTKYCGFSVTVPESVKPTVTASLTDATNWDDFAGAPTRGISQIAVSVFATPAYSSPIKAYSVTIDGVRYSQSSFTTGTLTKAGISPVAVTVIDARGRVGTWGYYMNVLDYEAPAVTKLTVHRCNADGTENNQGAYARVTFSAKVWPINNINAATYAIRYKKSSSSAWSTISIPALNNMYTPTERTQIFAADVNNAYDVELVVTDSMNTTAARTSVSTAFTLMDFHASGTGMAIGKMSEIPGALEIALDVYGKTGKKLVTIDDVYPVGSIYLAYNHIDPALFFGGTWVRIQNAFLWATDASGIIGQTGGEKEHTLTNLEMPIHWHSVLVANTASGSLEASNKARYNSEDTTYNGSVNTNVEGGDQPHNNMPPYIQVSVWRRTA